MNMMRLWLFTLLLVASPAMARQDDLFARFFSDHRAARANFVQTDESGTSTGVVVFGGMGKLRWEQKTPFESLTVSNGKVAWQVDMEMEQATKMKAEQSQGWAGAFANKRALAKSYAVSQKGKTLTLIPKSKEVSAGSVEFNDAGFPVLVQFKTWDDKQVVIRFTHWQRLKDGAGALFDYIPANGIDVVGGP